MAVTDSLLGYCGATPLPVGRDVMPFADLAWETQQEIADVVTAPAPPPMGLWLGPAQIPSRAWYEWHWHRGIDPERIRKRLPRWLRRQVIARDGLVCRLCGGEVAPDDVHIDHIKPVALGGTEDPFNLQVAHSLCNIRKGAKYDLSGETG